MQPWGYQSYGGTMVGDGKSSSCGMESIAPLYFLFLWMPKESLYRFLAEAKMDEVAAQKNWRRWVQEQRPW